MKASTDCDRKPLVVLISSLSARGVGRLPVGTGWAAANGGRMTLDVLQPVYRDSIYATQTEQRIVVRPRWTKRYSAQSVELRGRLLDAQGRELAVTKPGLKPAKDVPFDAKAMPAGTYSVERVLSARAARDWRWRRPSFTNGRRHRAASFVSTNTAIS